MKTWYTPLIALFLSASILSAHPTGHSDDATATAKHFLSQPDHLLGLCALLVTAAIAITLYTARRKGRSE